MNAVLESLCEARDNAMLTVMSLEDSLVTASDLASVHNILADRDEALREYAEHQHAVDTFFDAAPRPSLLKRIFAKN